ncbi:MAG TPA: hypothetical protein VN853_18690 [Polyangia bacterium]|jgi:hypothetical protein|nr:hypothetical protein [Polyangia bacterium]
MEKASTTRGRAAAPRKRQRAFARPRSDDANAFMPDPNGGPAHIEDDLAENLAEEFVDTVTRGDGADDAAIDGVVSEEIGGPFVFTSAADEFAHDIDAANPPDAEREPLPRPGAGLVQPPEEE